MFDFLDVYPWLLPFIIFFGRVIDVALGTLRIIFVSKGEKYKAPLIGFVEVFIWVVVISQILSRANDMFAYLCYAGGYAAGNYVGILLENRIAFGIVLFRIYTQKDSSELVKKLNKFDFGATIVKGKGSVRDIDIIETVIDRKKMGQLIKTINEFDNNSFYVVEDVRTKHNGIFPQRKNMLARWRIGK